MIFSEIDFIKLDLGKEYFANYAHYLNYEMGDAKVVQSWWNFKMTRKSDNKKIVKYILFTDTFNYDGMIVDEIVYYSDKNAHL